MLTLLGYLYLSGLWGSLIGWIILQPYALIALRGLWRLAAALPLVPMLAALSVTHEAFRNESSLWPIVLIFASPVALVWVGACIIAARAYDKAPR
jgi:hypothetical protein